MPDAKKYAGRAVYLFAFDIAYDMSREPVATLLGLPVAQFSIDVSKRNPRNLSFFRPQMVRLPTEERVGPHGPVRVEKTVKLLPVGALSITVQVPFAVDRIEDLVAYHDLKFSNGSLYEDVKKLAEQARRELQPHLIRPVGALAEEEGYTVFCIQSPISAESQEGPGTTETWLHNHRRQVAALLTQEADLELLSDQETVESTGRFLSYYETDLVVVDWDAALVIDEPADFEETLYVLELANLQLAELEAYDRILDDALERSYRDLRSRRTRSRKELIADLRDIRIDLARFSDELSNITKFFGDWHLARLYQAISARFHLAEWHRSIDEKLKTLDHLYQILKQDQNNRWMLMLEVTVVLLFIVDLVVLFSGRK